MAYNTDIFTGCTGLFVCLADWANTVTNGYFWTLMILSLGVVIFMATNIFGTNRSFAFSAVSMALLALLLRQLSLIPTFIMTLTMILAIIGIVVMINQRK